MRSITVAFDPSKHSEHMTLTELVKLRIEEIEENRKKLLAAEQLRAEKLAREKASLENNDQLSFNF